MINTEIKTQPTSQALIQKYFWAIWLAVENLVSILQDAKLYIRNYIFNLAV